MRRAVAIAIAATALIGAGAATPPTAPAGNPPVRLTIVTLPKLVGTRFALDGRTFVTGRAGYARIKTTPGTHLLQALDTTVRRRDTRSTFLRWSDGRFTGTRTITIDGNTRLYVGYRQSVRVSFRFTDPAGRPVVGRVTRVILSNTLGGQLSFRPEWPQWLPAISVTRRFGGLGETLVRYSIKQALVGGSNVVNQAQQRFYPAHTRQVTTRLLLYSARVSVRDFLLGTAAGSRLQLVYPNGTRAAYSLHGGELRLASLPRGTYQVDVRGGGYVPVVSLALSRNQVLKVRVISYLDMFLFLVMALAAMAALALVARPYLRLRIRSLGSGKRPTPDDLEPVKPLSGARKALIVRYMVPASSSRTARSVQRLPVRTAAGIAVEQPENREARRRRTIPRGVVGAALDRLHRLRESRRRILRPRRLPGAHREPPREALSGERLELVHVYMGEAIAPAPAPASEVAVPAEQAQPVAAAPVAPEAGERRKSLLVARQRAALVGLRALLRKGVRRLHAIATAAARAARRAAGKLGSAQPVQVSPSPAVERAPAPRSETIAAPAPESVPPPSEPTAAASSDPEPAEPSKQQPGKEQVAPKPKRTRAPAAKKPAAQAKAKTGASAKPKANGAGAAKPKAKTTKAKPTKAKAKKAAPAAAKTPTARKPKQPKTKQAPVATEQSLDGAYWPDLAAAVEVLREDLRKARPAPPPKKRKRASTDGTTTPAKPKAARSAKQTKAKKATEAIEQAADQDANGTPSIQELAQFRPDLAAAVEALQEDLRNARTETTKKGRRKSSAKAR